MSFLTRLLSREIPPARTVRLIDHTEPFDFKGIDRISMLGEPVAELIRTSPIPFGRGQQSESAVPFDPTAHRAMDGQEADTVHRFKRPDGVPLLFLFKDGVLIQIVDNAAAYPAR